MYINREFEILNSRLVLKLNMTKMWSELQGCVFCQLSATFCYGVWLPGYCQHVYHDHIRGPACLEDLLNKIHSTRTLYSSFLHLLVWLCHTYRQAACHTRAVHAQVR